MSDTTLRENLRAAGALVADLHGRLAEVDPDNEHLRYVSVQDGVARPVREYCGEFVERFSEDGSALSGLLNYGHDILAAIKKLQRQEEHIDRRGCLGD